MKLSRAKRKEDHARKRRERLLNEAYVWNHMFAQTSIDLETGEERVIFTENQAREKAANLRKLARRR